VKHVDLKWMCSTLMKNVNYSAFSIFVAFCRTCWDNLEEKWVCLCILYI